MDQEFRNEKARGILINYTAVIVKRRFVVAACSAILPPVHHFQIKR